MVPLRPNHQEAYSLVLTALYLYHRAIALIWQDIFKLSLCFPVDLPGYIKLLTRILIKAIVKSLLFERLLVSSLKQVKPSTISTAKLNVLLRLHMLPIKQIVYLRSYS